MARLYQIFLFFLLSFIAIAPVAADNLTNGAILSYSMENFPAGYANDYSGNGYSLVLTDYINMVDNVNPKIANWDVKTNYSSNKVLNDQNFPYAFNINGNGANPYTVSFWYKGHKANGMIPVFSYGSLGVFYNFVITNGATNDSVAYVYWDGGSTSNGCEAKQFGSSTPSLQGINGGAWNHIVIESNRTGPLTSSQAVFYNGNLVGTMSSTIPNGAGGNPSNGGSPYFIEIGRVPDGTSCVSGGSNLLNSLVSNGTAIDQFMIYNRTLTSTEVSTLYSNGVGFDPFDARTPVQVASIAPIGLVFNGYQQRDFSSYFNYGSWNELSFNYSNANYLLKYSGTSSVNTGTFAVSFTSPSIVSFWGYGTVVPSVNMSVRSCNNNGCSAWYTTLILSVGYNGTGAYQIADIAPISLNTDSSTYRAFSNYFVGYTNRFIQYKDPINFSTQYVSQNYTAQTPCADMSITGDNLIINSKNITCTIGDVYFIVDDGSVAVISNPLSINVQGVNGVFKNGSIGAGIGGAITGFGNLFPPYNTISSQTRMTYVIVVMLITVLLGAFIIFNSGNGMFTAIGIGAFLLIEFLYFTSIHYVPILWIALFAIIIVVLGIGFATRQTVGNGG